MAKFRGADFLKIVETQLTEEERMVRKQCLTVLPMYWSARIRRLSV